MKRCIALGIILISAAAVSFSCKKIDKEKENALIVKAAVGKVTIITGKQKRSPQIGDKIKENSIIRTGRASMIDVQYANAGVIRIYEKSRVHARELSQNTSIDLKSGKVFVVLSKLKKDATFRVKTNTTVAAIRGTSFKVSSDKKKSRISVLKGKVKVNPVKKGKVIEEIEEVVETNKTVELDEKEVDKVIEREKPIEVAVLKIEEVKEIKEEVENITIDEEIDDEIKEEIEEVGIKGVVVDAKTGKKIEEIEVEKSEEDDEELEKELARLEEQQKIEEQKKKEELKRKEEEKKLERERKAEEKRLQVEQKKKEREERLKNKRERKERKAKARAEARKKRLMEQKKEKARKELKKKEDRVKNIPTL